MSLPPLPDPVMSRQIHAFTKDIVCFEHYSKEQMQAYGQSCYEKALLDAMNATLPFGKTGAVIAAAIGALK